MIDEFERAERERIVQFAMDNNRLSGLLPDEDLLRYSQKWICGEITLDELGKNLYEKHGLEWKSNSAD